METKHCYHIPHVEEVELLRRRARSLLARSGDSLVDGDYDVASFPSEQSLRLYLKSILLEELGDFPRTIQFPS
ncbi:MAG: HEPN domain-containing protein [Candidatus Caldarchaeum sp.]